MKNWVRKFWAWTPAIIFFLIALYGVTQLTMETGTGTYLDENTPRGALLSHYTETYGSSALMLIFETPLFYEGNQ